MFIVCVTLDVGKIVSFQAANVKLPIADKIGMLFVATMVYGGKQAALQAAVATACREQRCRCKSRSTSTSTLNQFRVPASPRPRPRPKLTKSSRDNLCRTALHEVPKPA